VPSSKAFVAAKTPTTGANTIVEPNTHVKVMPIILFFIPFSLILEKYFSILYLVYSLLSITAFNLDLIRSTKKAFMR
jgi:hypothetical protein